ncbi:hypothetical protein A3C28_06360 [Candidatus Roizmanbacteria bacterium RIFCSPHIGHO2_02_FULL_39_9]|uniref:Ribulose-phosphate 3-epimerase n=1 Tax=Candidatus Roizmanbacteria bacterium RIFCSPHIGHO2_02_FULL_39_9 TaxID=1802040 RepID=A0A1F7H6E3_9BACT|nr:MAG: hypothetical protein A3C28_06360 [Candidatus Roizmanbacteria bacterium RIFCSPHIGHO2_02_FULL_39_9]
MMKVAPTLLAYTDQELTQQFSSLRPYFDQFQVDIQDGKFITNRTVSLHEYLSHFSSFDNKQIKKYLFDFHYQTLSYEEDMETLWRRRENIQIGIHLIHYSLKPDFENLKKMYPDFSFGLVLNPEDSVEQLTINYNLQTVDGVQIMSIHPGPQGTPFMPETLTKIEQLRQIDYRSEIYLDGGINLDTLPVIKKQTHTPNFLCIGSYLTKSSNISVDVQKLNEELSA